jgi:hypothetical protein
MNRPTVKLMDSHCKHYYYSIVSDHSTQSLSAVITDFGDLKPVQAEQYARKSISDWDSDTPETIACTSSDYWCQNAWYSNT